MDYVSKGEDLPKTVPSELIAIDGSAGTGKSTLARLLARRLSLAYLDTGATFRMLALAALESDIAVDDGERLAEFCEGLQISFEDARAYLGTSDVTQAIRDDHVSSAASRIAVHLEVREFLKLWQRDWVLSHGASVVEGRDIGSVVFPQAILKVYLWADHNVRSQRRVESSSSMVRERDERDANRTAAPLTRVADAVSIDTSGLVAQEVADIVVALWRERHLSGGGEG